MVDPFAVNLPEFLIKIDDEEELPPGIIALIVEKVDASLIQVVAKKNIIMKGADGKEVRVVALIKKGADDNLLANVANYFAEKRGEVVEKPKAKPEAPVKEVWEDQYGNNVKITESIKKLKVTTEEALRKDEDKNLAEKRRKQEVRMLGISRMETLYKKEVEKTTLEATNLDNRETLIKILKDNKEEEVTIQHTQCMYPSTHSLNPD
ncbi:unnamed protein product [Gongylonema pulchrum]|uniref:Stn1 domain-containing protein n=1 Tax=Gongylonema pulchrum TaxID=637853 RepID=A0A183EIS6_9BILA|nr:unnamed protein product [Gongylonema pulchrum]